jgi:hypothetical protein
MKKEETHELPKLDAGSILLRFLKELWNTFKVLPIAIKKFHQVWNEAWFIVIGILAWQYSAEVVRYIDPSLLKEFTGFYMRFAYATIGAAIAHFVVTLMLRLSHPNIFRYLYGLFYVDLYQPENELKSYHVRYDLKILRVKYSLIMFAVYLSTWLILVATY